MKRIAAYSLLFVAVVVATFYLRFPYAEVVRDTLVRHPLPGGVSVEFASLSPAGLGIRGRELVIRQGDRDLLRASRFRAGGLVRSLRTPHLTTTLDTLGGTLHLALAAAEGGRYDVQVEGDHLAAAPLLALFFEGFAETTGALDTHLTYGGVPAHWEQGEGEGEISGGAGQIAGLTLLGQPLPPIPYDKLAGRITLDKGIAHLEHWSLTGPGLSATVEGRVHLRPEFSGSILDLECEVHLPEAVATQMADLLELAAPYRQRDGSYKIHLRGSVDQPRLR